MPALLQPLFFPSRPSSRRLEKKSGVILDVEEATGAPRLTSCDVFGPESRNGLFCANNPVNWSDPYGLQETERLVITGKGIPHKHIDLGGGGGGGNANHGSFGQGERGINIDRAIDRQGRSYDPKKDGLGVNRDPMGPTSDRVISTGALPIEPPTVVGGAGSPFGPAAVDSFEPFTIDPTMLVKYGRGFDRPGLERLARVTNGFGIGVSVVVALPVAVPLAIDSFAFAAAHPMVIVNTSSAVSGYYGLGIEANFNLGQVFSEGFGEALAQFWPPYPGH